MLHDIAYAMNGSFAFEQTTRIDPMRVAALHALLGQGAAPATGAALPAFWHWGQFWDIAPAEALGRDGHPEPGVFLPETGLARRMWAGGALEFHGPIGIGAPATRHSHASAPVHKTGRSGPLAFVTVTHRIESGGRLALTERQDLVYRPDPAPDATPPTPEQAPRDETHQRAHAPNAVDLFRYSALTFNGHRIHYDADYARDVEGYSGPVIHGPLLAQHLIALAGEVLGEVRHFSFRALSPLCLPQSYTACARPEGAGLSLWIRASDGGLAMRAEAA